MSMLYTQEDFRHGARRSTIQTRPFFVRFKYIVRIVAIALVCTLFQTSSGSGQDVLRNVELFDYVNPKRPRNDSHSFGRRYVWNFQGKSFTVVMEIDVESYNGYASAPRSDIPDMIAKDMHHVVPLTRVFAQYFRKHPLTREDRTNFVLAFIQSLPYTYDDVSTGYDEFRRYALETLLEGGGDCEDTTILGCAILAGMGFDLLLINPPGHIAFGVAGDFSGAHYIYEGKKYYYCETTGTGWKVGKIPKFYRGVQVQMAPIVSADLVPLIVPVPSVPDPSPESSPVSPKPKKRSGSAAVVFLLMVGAGLMVVLLRGLMRTDPDSQKAHRGTEGRKPSSGNTDEDIFDGEGDKEDIF